MLACFRLSIVSGERGEIFAVEQFVDFAEALAGATFAGTSGSSELIRRLECDEPGDANPHADHSAPTSRCVPRLDYDHFLPCLGGNPIRFDTHNDLRPGDEAAAGPHDCRRHG